MAKAKNAERPYPPPSAQAHITADTWPDTLYPKPRTPLPLTSPPLTPPGHPCPAMTNTAETAAQTAAGPIISDPNGAAALEAPSV